MHVGCSASSWYRFPDFNGEITLLVDSVEGGGSGYAFTLTVYGDEPVIKKQTHKQQ